jgi:hypothetical protein
MFPVLFAMKECNPMKNQNQIHALKTKLNAMKDDLHNMAFSEYPLDALVAQSNKIRALKTKITKLENAR